MSDAKLYLGNLAQGTRDRDIEDAFDKFGRIRKLILKNGYGFVVKTKQTTNFDDQFQTIIEFIQLF